MTFRFPPPIVPLNPARPLPKGLSWYALIAKRAREYSAARWLEEKLGNCFTLVPLETRHKSKGQRGGFREVRVTYQVPVMPRIVFAGFSMPPNWLAIWDNDETMSNIVAAIGNQGAPSPMQVSEVERFRSNLDADRAAAGLPTLKVGATARFAGSGIFGGHLLEIASLGPTSATVWQDWFGTKREVKVARDDLEPIDNSRA